MKKEKFRIEKLIVNNNVSSFFSTNSVFKTNAALWSLFLIWPLLGFICAWKNVGQKHANAVIICFYFLFGLCFIVNPTMDSAGRAEALIDASNKPFFDFSSDLFETKTDIFDFLIIHTVSRFTSWHGALFAVYATIFGFLSIRYISILIKNEELFDVNWNIFCFLWMIVWVNSIFEIGGFRMWSGAWIFSIGALQFLYSKKDKFILISGLSLLMHFSYFPLLILLLIYRFFGNRILIYSIFAIISFFVSELDVDLLRNYAGIINPAVQKKVEVYTKEEYVDFVSTNKENLAWFMTFSNKGVLYFSVVLLFLIVFKNAKSFSSYVLSSFISFSLLLLSFSNLSSLIPSGGRFRTLFYIFVFTTFIIFFNRHLGTQKFGKFIILGLPALILSNLIVFRYGSEMFNSYLLGPSPTILLGLFDPFPLSNILF